MHSCRQCIDEAVQNMQSSQLCRPCFTLLLAEMLCMLQRARSSERPRSPKTAKDAGPRHGSKKRGTSRPEGPAQRGPQPKDEPPTQPALEFADGSSLPLPVPAGSSGGAGEPPAPAAFGLDALPPALAATVSAQAARARQQQQSAASCPQ